MSLAMTLSALVRWRISVANGCRISSVPGISQDPVEITKADMPQPDVIQHLALDVATDAGGDHPVDQFAVARLHQIVGREFRELAAASARQNVQHLLVEGLVDVP